MRTLFFKILIFLTIVTGSDSSMRGETNPYGRAKTLSLTENFNYSPVVFTSVLRTFCFNPVNTIRSNDLFCCTHVLSAKHEQNIFHRGKNRILCNQEDFDKQSSGDLTLSLKMQNNYLSIVVPPGTKKCLSLNTNISAGYCLSHSFVNILSSHKMTFLYGFSLKNENKVLSIPGLIKHNNFNNNKITGNCYIAIVEASRFVFLIESNKSIIGLKNSNFLKCPAKIPHVPFFSETGHNSQKFKHLHHKNKSQGSVKLFGSLQNMFNLNKKHSGQSCRNKIMINDKPEQGAPLILKKIKQ